MKSIQVSDSTYIPENFSSKFHGKVTAEFALYNLLNIPVALLQQVGIAKFKELLKNANFKQIIKREKHLGFPWYLGLWSLRRGTGSFICVVR